jgi:hypothetical protein
MKQRFKIILAIILPIISALILAQFSYQISLLDEENTISPLILPMPDTNNNSAFDRTMMNSLQLSVKLSKNSNSIGDFSFNMTQGSTTKINVAVSSLVNATLTVPLYLSVGAFENQRLPKLIVAPPSPYPSLPWTSYKDSPNMTKPFDASFEINPLTLEPKENKSESLTVRALEDAPIGKYTMFLELGDWEQTGLAAVTFQITVLT